jgi:hypothetical protein
VAPHRALAASDPLPDPRSREGTLGQMKTRDVAVGEGPLRGPRGGWAQGMRQARELTQVSQCAVGVIVFGHLDRRRQPSSSMGDRRVLVSRQSTRRPVRRHVHCMLVFPRTSPRPVGRSAPRTSAQEREVRSPKQTSARWSKIGSVRRSDRSFGQGGRGYNGG